MVKNQFTRNSQIRIIIVTSIIFIGCNKLDIISEEPVETPSLYLYMDLPINDSLYVFTYPIGSSSSYTSVLYQTEPMVRVFWYSNDFFTIIHWGREFHYPIINYSTYSDGEDGSGKQMIYVSPSHIGDTLEVTGCIDDNCKSLQFLVE